MPSDFEGFLEKFVSGTKQARDQMNRAAHIAKLRMELLSINQEKNRFNQMVGDKVYGIYAANNGIIDSNQLLESIGQELAQLSQI